MVRFNLRKTKHNYRYPVKTYVKRKFPLIKPRGRGKSRCIYAYVDRLQKKMREKIQISLRNARV